MTQSTHPVSRIGGASDESGDPILVDMYTKIRARRGYILNIHQVVGFSPKMLRAQATYAHSMREESVLPRDLQELLIIRVAQISQFRVRADGAPADRARLRRDFGLDQRAVRLAQCKGFQRKGTRGAGICRASGVRRDVDDALFAATSKIFSKQEIVEMTVLVSWYVGNAHFVRALRIAPQIDPTLKK